MLEYENIFRDKAGSQGDARGRTMGYRRYDLQEAFFVPGSLGFRVWGYGTDDPLEDVLRPGYFALAGAQLRPGELVFARMQPARARRVGAAPRPVAAAGPDQGDVHMALLVVVRGARRGTVSARLVQDFGPDQAGAAHGPAPALAASPGPASPPARRGRGRPPGSRTRTKAALPTTMPANQPDMPPPDLPPAGPADA
jgi:hypothetical protein